MRFIALAIAAALTTASVAYAAEPQHVWTSRATGQKPRVFVVIGDPPTGILALALGRQYELEWTANDQPMPSNLTGISECYYDIAKRYSCEALRQWFGDVPARTGRTPVAGMAPEAFLLKNLEFDTEYCFRFKDQVLPWSQWTCAHTQVAPPRPGAPERPVLTSLAAASGAGVPGGDTPFRILVEWKNNPSNQNIEHEEAVQILEQETWRSSPGGISNGEKILAFPIGADPEAVYSVRVCAFNISGEACSPIARTAGREYLEKVPAGGRASRFPAPAGSDTYDPNTPAAVPAGPLRAQGRVRLDPANAPPSPARSVCELAQVARARNSPAAPGLEARCAMHSTLGIPGLAARGEAIANQDPLAVELRNQQPDDAARRGFDTGMAAAEGQTEPGPGKQRIHDALNNNEQGGYTAAVAYSLDRNKWSKQASCGARMAAADPAIATARAAEPGALHRLGFDIGTQFFGPTALGAEGSKGTGPGSLSVRNRLSIPAQAGFDSSFAFHVRQNYNNVYPAKLCVLE